MADSNVEPVERRLKPKEESNRTEQQKMASESRSEPSGKHKRKRPTNDSDSEEKPPAIEFDALLDELYRPMIQPPPSVGHWNEDHNDKMVRHYFKMKRCTVTPEAFVTRYLYSGEVSAFEVMKLLSEPEMGPILNYLDKSTSYIDFTEEYLFSSELPNEQSQRKKRETVTKFILKLSREIDNFSQVMQGVPLKLYKTMTKYLEGHVVDWVTKLAYTVERHPCNVTESDYEDIFKKYLKLFDWDCYSGNSTKLAIPYRDGEVYSVPDILARKYGIPTQNRLVVEVKRMTLDPTLKRAFKKGILSKSSDEVKAPKIKRKNVDFKSDEASTQKQVDSNSEEASTVEQSEDNDTDVEDEPALDKGESRVSASQRKFIKLFFGELFGSVLAMDCCFPPGPEGPAPRLGIGVVGFRVVFFTFCAEPVCRLKDITRDPNSQLKVYMTSELSLLKAADRRKINEILLAISVSEG